MAGPYRSAGAAAAGGRHRRRGRRTRGGGRRGAQRHGAGAAAAAGRGRERAAGAWWAAKRCWPARGRRARAHNAPPPPHTRAGGEGPQRCPQALFGARPQARHHRQLEIRAGAAQADCPGVARQAAVRAAQRQSGGRFPPPPRACDDMPLCVLCRGPVLIFGEPGLEKANVASLVHFGSPEHASPMVRIECDR